jgi:putative heme-binding domain-containing protein
LAAALSAREAPAVRAAAIKALGRDAGNSTASIFIKAWASLPFSDRATIADMLLGNPTGVRAMLDAAESGNFPLGELDPVRRSQLERQKDPALLERAKKLLARTSGPKRAEVIENYRPALSLVGDAARGKAVHEKACASCHKVADKGYEIGPSLAAAANRGAESLLLNILDPNREVNPQFLAYVIETKEGRTLTGMITSETPTSISLVKQGGERDTLARLAIEEIRSTGKSLMPEGLEQQLDRQAMADLIAFLLKP